ncbi:MAG TPA: acyl-CoA dehydrogenase family protein [Solirubrobacteraceae bacterium]|jgi:cyclohexanecarboxyl-CoA dehydrogenase|nr:acyl-CoA dehydrogenase family protein [Solirubrobacteraceae bacterium]
MSTTTAPIPFVLDEEHELFRESVRNFAEAKLRAGYHARAASDELPAEAIRLLGAQQLLGLTVPEDLGGQDADLLALGIACEQVARADFNLAYFIFASIIATDLIKHNERGRELLPGLAAGETLIAAAITEPGVGSDAANLSAFAERVPGGWRLQGEKSSISLGPHADAAVVFARTDRAAGAGGVTAFIVDLDDTVARQRFEDPGFRPIGRGALTFEGTFVPERNRLSPEGRGFHMVMHEFDLSRPLIALMCVGLVDRALEMTVEYTRQRTAFGQPIARFQGVAFPLAEHATYCEMARWLGYRTLGLRMAGKPHTKEAAMLKWWGPHMAVQAIHECIVLHGHVAWSEEMPLQQMLRDASGYEIGDGTPQIQKAVIAREMTGREFLSYPSR